LFFLPCEVVHVGIGPQCRECAHVGVLQRLRNATAPVLCTLSVARAAEAIFVVHAPPQPTPRRQNPRRQQQRRRRVVAPPRPLPALQTQSPLRKRVSLFGVLQLCLSRACLGLGKTIICCTKRHKKGDVLPSSITLSLLGPAGDDTAGSKASRKFSARFQRRVVSWQTCTPSSTLVAFSLFNLNEANEPPPAL
jgi:hypothetical protein